MKITSNHRSVGKWYSGPHHHRSRENITDNKPNSLINNNSTRTDPRHNSTIKDEEAEESHELMKHVTINNIIIIIRQLSTIVVRQFMCSGSKHEKPYRHYHNWSKKLIQHIMQTNAVGEKLG